MAKDLLMAEILHQLIATSSFIPLFTRFYTSQAVVWDVWTSNKRIQHKLLLAPFRPHCHFANATFSRQVFMDPHHKTITGREFGAPPNIPLSSKRYGPVLWIPFFSNTTSPFIHVCFANVSGKAHDVQSKIQEKIQASHHQWYMHQRIFCVIMDI